MGLTKSGSIQYRSKTSKCQGCKYFLSCYNCWYYSYIPYRIFENCVGYECEHFSSSIKGQCNSHYVFRDFEDKKLFPEKVFGGKYRFDKAGNRVGLINYEFKDKDDGINYDNPFVNYGDKK